jgi:hypothetical protein
MSPSSVAIVNAALHDPPKLLFAGDDDVVESSFWLGQWAPVSLKGTKNQLAST